MIANLRVFRNVVVTITYISEVLTQNNFVSEKRYSYGLEGGHNNRR
jgi:hypothetical protein